MLFDIRLGDENKPGAFYVAGDAPELAVRQLLLLAIDHLDESGAYPVEDAEEEDEAEEPVAEDDDEEEAAPEPVSPRAAGGPDPSTYAGRIYRELLRLQRKSQTRYLKYFNGATECHGSLDGEAYLVIKPVEIAELTGISPGSVGTTMSYLRKEGWVVNHPHIKTLPYPIQVVEPQEDEA